MEAPNRWVVTYTKHLTQKRKVYKDGVLELHVPDDKVILFNDCGEVLDSRFLKKNEVIESGGTLAFAAYLVDVAEIEVESEALRESKSQLRSNESSGKTSIKGGKIARSKVSTENKICGSLPTGAQRNRPISMRNFAKRNNQAGSQNSGEAQSHSSSTETTNEWNALFTTQLTQKAKKYHDGKLKLSFKGFRQKQVMLYDESGKLLSSKFLKKDEVVESGGALSFDGYLVEIGDVKESSKHLDGLNLKDDTYSCMNKQQAGAIPSVGKCESRSQTVAASENNLNFTEGTAKGKSESRSQTVAAAEDNLNFAEDTVTEWHAMYTAQITQKIKKYHDGILRLSFCGSHSKQVSLLTEDRTLLIRVHIQSTEKLRSGNTLQLANYLIEIGELQTSRTGELQIGASSAKVVALDDGNSSVKNLMTDGWLQINKSVRDARQILAVLKRPKVEENLSPRELVMVQTNPSATEDLLQSNHLESGVAASFKKELGGTVLRNSVEDNSRYGSQISASENGFPLVKAARGIHSTGLTTSIHDSCEEKLLFVNGRSSSSSIPSTSDARTSIFSPDLLCSEAPFEHSEGSQFSSCTTSRSPGKNLTYCSKLETISNCSSNADTYLKAASNTLHGHLQGKDSLIFTGSESNIGTQGSRRFSEQSSNIKSISLANQEKPNQVQGSADNVEKGLTGYEEASPLDSPSNLNILLDSDSINSRMEYAGGLKSQEGDTMEMDETPSFDLGI
ncbi:uncharacterized protein [Aristolochia californica]|uniref:uncharacterized protein isoform X2 n=1 Tax=Aristolochia californica TaxID=171875 RepID=UPI0035E282B7